jgi:hypothetical protein
LGVLREDNKKASGRYLSGRFFFVDPVVANFVVIGAFVLIVVFWGGMGGLF